MKKVILGLAACSLFSLAMIAAPQNRSFAGEIVDDACASSGGHSSMQAKGETNEHCTGACVKAGSKYVLYDAPTKTIYKLDNQKMPDAFAGTQVVVTGTVDQATSTVHVVSISAAK
jgi:hypothetical protein